MSKFKKGQKVKLKGSNYLGTIEEVLPNPYLFKLLNFISPLNYLVNWDAGYTGSQVCTQSELEKV